MGHVLLGSRSRCFAAGSLFVALSFGIAQAPAQQNSPFSDYINSYTSQIRSTISSSGASGKGLLLTSIYFPAGGRLIRRSDRGIEGSCSGVMITRKHFLTAAHCVCQRKAVENQYYLTGKSCIVDNAPNFYRNRVYIPASGFYDVDKVQVFGSFTNYPKAEDVPNGTILGDLAVLELKGSVAVEPIPLIEQQTVNRYVTVGFGMFALREENADQLGILPGPYNVGLGTAAFVELKSCPKGYADIYCGHYSTFGFAPGDFSTAVCPGDSGGPLIGLTPENKAYVVGITSQRLTRGTPTGCDATQVALSIFTRISQHNSWLSEYFIAGDPLFASVQCREGVLRSHENVESVVEMPTQPGPSVVSIAAASILGKRFAKLEIQPQDGQNITCGKIDDHEETFQCYSNSTGVLKILVRGDGLVAVAECKLEK